MAPAHDTNEQGSSAKGLESTSQGKQSDLQDVDDVENKSGPLVTSPSLRPTLEAPQLIQNMTSEERRVAENRLRRKVDFRLMPMIIVMYILNYLDRNNIAAAKLAGIVEDLNLTGVQYPTSVSILFVGYLLMQIPSNLFLNKIGKPGIYLPTCMVIWGIISTATAACQSFGGLIACRFMLGVVEAAYFPGCLYYMSCWYTRSELGLRTAIFYSGSLISGAFSGLIAAGVEAHLNGAKGLLAWRWLFIIEGSITIFIAAISFFFLPNFPRTTKWLTEEERVLATWRLEEDIGEDDWVDSHQQKFGHGFKLAIMDPKTYVLTSLIFGIVAAASVTNFFPTVVATLNYNNVDSLLLTAPPYVLAVLTSYLNSWHADKTGERFLHVTLPLCIGVIAFIIAASTTATAPRYVSMMLMVPGVYTGYSVGLAWISNSIPRPPAKRAVALAFVNCISNSSSIWTAYLYTASAGPRYRTAMIFNCCMTALAIISALVLRIILAKLNKKLDQGIFVEGAINSGTVAAGKKGFRFNL